MTKVNYKQLGEVNLIIDGNNLMFRNFDYSGHNMLYTSDGKPTVSLHRTLKQILQLYGLFNVRSITVAFDEMTVNKATVRHLMYPMYKGTRSEKPQEILPQFDYLKEGLSAAKVNYIVSPNLYEADDVIATIAYTFAMNKQRNIIISSDGDMMQLVSNYTAFLKLGHGGKEDVMYTLKTDNEALSMKSIKSEFDILPTQFSDLKGLTGDSSDNIPGVNGIGLGKALPLIQKYTNLDNLYDALLEIQEGKVNIKDTPLTPKLMEKLLQDEQEAFLSRELAIMNRNINLTVELTRGNFRSDEVRSFLRKYELKEIEEFLFNYNNQQ